MRHICVGLHTFCNAKEALVNLGATGESLIRLKEAIGGGRR